MTKMSILFFLISMSALELVSGDLIGWNRGINTYSRFGESRGHQSQPTIYYRMIQRGMEQPEKLKKIIDFVKDHKSGGKNILESNRRKNLVGKMRMRHLRNYLTS